MNLPLFVIFCGAIFVLAYVIYGRLLARLLRLDPRAVTPATSQRDDRDYVPLSAGPLFNQHFSAIAAAGPIVGPIMAGVLFGWAPALIWILVGAVFIGGAHDLTTLIASVRHRGQSIARVVAAQMSQRSYVAFLLFIWVALVYVVVAFTDVTAASFVGAVALEGGGEVSGPGIATSSFLYLVLPVCMGLLQRFGRISLGILTVFFLPLAGVAIWAGQHLPFDLAQILGLSDSAARRTWSVALLLYCLIASLTPMWVLLQPRGHLGGFFLLIALGGGALGLMLSGRTIEYPAFIGWSSAGGAPLAPVLFITIACGACSGFHAMVASGTTSKQLRSEADALPVGYGAMLLEGMVAIVSLCCVMMLPVGAALLTGPGGPQPNYLYANGIGAFLETLGIPKAAAVTFALMAFTTFIYDTLDVCTRLGRYVIQELLGRSDALGRWVATLVTVGAPAVLLLSAPPGSDPSQPPAWRMFWNLFGASNQLLAALTLLAVTTWLWRTRRAAWVWLVCGAPAAFMYVMSSWELIRTIQVHAARKDWASPVLWVAALLLGLAALLLVEAAAALRSARRTTPVAQPAVSEVSIN